MRGLVTIGKTYGQFKPSHSDDPSFPRGFVSSWEEGREKLRSGDFTEMVNAYTGWVYKCVFKNAQEVSTHSLKLYLLQKNQEEAVEVVNHILLDLLGSINPTSTQQQILEMTQTFSDLTGNAYWYLPKNRLGMPQEVWNVPSQFMTVVPAKEHLVMGYLYTRNGQSISFYEDEIVHFKYPNPKSLYYGMSPLQAMAYAVTKQENIDKYGDNIFKNRGRPDVMIGFPEDVDLGSDERERLIAEWRRNFRGTTKAGKVAILDKGGKAEPFSAHPVEMDFVESSKFSSADICSAFGIPMSLLVGGASNRATAYVEEYSWIKYTVYPRMKRIAEKINQKIIPLYQKGVKGKLFVAFDNPVPLDQELELKKQENRSKLYLTSPNEERKKLGMSDASWGAVPLAPLSIVPLGSADTEGGKGLKAVAKDIDAVIERKKRVHNLMTDKLEALYVKRLRKLFKSFYERIQINIDRFKSYKSSKGAEDFMLIPLADMEKELWELSQQDISNAVEQGWLMQMAETGIEIDWSPDNSDVILELQKRKSQIKTVAKNYHQEIKNILSEGIDSGMSIDDIAANFGKWFNETEQWKAVRIARTEMGGCRNAGEYYYSMSCPQLTKKRWLHSHSANSRPEHVAMNGVEIRKEQNFIVMGEGLRFPGDERGSGKNIINCRCTVIYI